MQKTDFEFFHRRKMSHLKSEFTYKHNHNYVIVMAQFPT